MYRGLPDLHKSKSCQGSDSSEERVALELAHDADC